MHTQEKGKIVSHRLSCDTCLEQFLLSMRKNNLKMQMTICEQITTQSVVCTHIRIPLGSKTVGTDNNQSKTVIYD